MLDDLRHSLVHLLVTGGDDLIIIKALAHAADLVMLLLLVILGLVQSLWLGCNH